MYSWLFLWSLSMSVYFSPIAIELREFLNIFLYLNSYHIDVYKHFPLFQRLLFWFHWLFLSQAEAFHVHFCFCCLISGENPRTIARSSMTVCFFLTLFSRSVTGSALTLNPSVDFKLFLWGVEDRVANSFPACSSFLQSPNRAAGGESCKLWWGSICYFLLLWIIFSYLV